MRTTTILLAGAMLSLAAFGGSNDPSAEERYRMKNGRYTPTEEARRKAQKDAQAKAGTKGEAPTCCRHMNTSFKNANADTASNEARFRMKYGRNTPAAEARERAAVVEMATHIQKCEELGKCTLMQAETPATKNSTVAIGDPGRDARFRMKYGRSLPVEESLPGATRELVASADQVVCEHACCTGSE